MDDQRYGDILKRIEDMLRRIEETLEVKFKRVEDSIKEVDGLAQRGGTLVGIKRCEDSST